MAELSLVGISHRGAALEVRERVALDPDEAAELARDLAGDEGEAVCLSTCNRTELYVAGPGAEERAAGALSDVDGALYRRSDDEAARHLQRLFDNEAIPLWVWPWLIVAGLVFFLVVEAEKLFIRSSASLRSVVTAVEAGA